MKTLELNRMEGIEGGGIDCDEGWGIAVGLTASLVVITIATGGATAPALLSIGTLWGGGLAAGSNC